jgi:hypothetical protein
MRFNELEQSILYVKKAVFKYWDKFGPVKLRLIIDHFSLKPATSIVLKKWMFEWIGGDEFFKKLKRDITSKEFRCQYGTYDFLFVVTDFSSPGDDSDYEVFVHTEVDSKGSCYITDDDIVYKKIIDAIKDENIGWEVDNEVKDCIYETLNEKYEFFRTFHINVVEIDFVNF